MQTQTTCSLSPQDLSEREDRETFSHQTLILTALTAINSSNKHPTFNNAHVIQERLTYMNEKAFHTPTIDAATTLLVTDTEILATMAHGSNALQGIVTVKEIEKSKDQLEEDKKKLDALFESGLKNGSGTTEENILRMDGLLSEEFYTVNYPENSDPVEDLFISFPNINEEVLIQKSTERLPIDLSQQSSTSSDPICRPIEMGNGHWAEIQTKKKGYIFESTK